ncbi:MAG: hypothetical protein OHK0038_15590 [Flammeovirgaceae bacterium]
MNAQYISFFQKFHLVDNQIIELLIEKTLLRTYKKGDLITKEGDIQKNLFLVEEGVQMSFYNHDGKQHVIAFTYPPSVSGIPDSFFFQKPSKFELQAVTDSKLRGISYENLQKLLDQSHSLERLFRKMTEFRLW